MKPQILESMMTGRENLSLDQDSNGADVLGALHSIRNGERILGEMSLCNRCERIGNCFMYDLFLSWQYRMQVIVPTCRDFKEKPCANSS